MTTVGQIEKKTQYRIVTLLRGQLGYDYLGKWEERSNNRNVEPELLTTLLTRQGHDASLIPRTIHLREQTAIAPSYPTWLPRSLRWSRSGTRPGCCD